MVVKRLICVQYRLPGLYVTPDHWSEEKVRSLNVCRGGTGELGHNFTDVILPFLDFKFLSLSLDKIL